MTNPDNVGGLPELPAPDFMLRWDSMRAAYYVSRPNIGNTDVYTSDQMRAYGELCRAAPAGGDELDTLLALVPRPAMAHHKMDEAEAREIKRVNRFRDRVIENIRAHCASRPVSAPAGSGEVLDSWQKWPIINRLQMQANDCEDAADMESDAVIMPLQLKALAADLREAAALLRKLQQGADYVIVPRELTLDMELAAKAAAFDFGTDGGWDAGAMAHEVWRAAIAASQGQEGGANG